MPSRTPLPSSEAARNRMKATRRSGTEAETRLARALEKQSIDFETGVKILDEHRFVADFVVRDEKIAIFVDGCFWHGCPIHGTKSKSNSRFWDEKIEANKRRDQRAVEILESNGWMPIRIWEHENADEVAANIRQLLIGGVRSSSS